jgi:starch synthase
MDQVLTKTEKINVLFSAVEADPFVKVGGLGDVAYALPYALRNLHPEDINNHEIDIRLVIPCHSFSCDFQDTFTERTVFDVKTAMGDIPTTAYSTEINGLPIYIISSRLIPQDTSVYTSDDYVDGLKFLFFSQATLALVKHLNWQPDIFHVNDWHTAITPYLIDLQKSNGRSEGRMKSVLTIHNLPFLGTGTEEAINDLGIPFSSNSKLPVWARKLPLPIGLSASDKIVAVSPTYANEILTPEFGCGLDKYLSMRKNSLSGIVNGIDTQLWNPATDSEILARYSIHNLYERQNNKHVLQNELKLQLDPDIPLLAFIGRMSHQKGIDLIIDGLRLLKGVPWQAIILGTGEVKLEKQALQLESEFPDNVRTLIKYDSKFSRRIYAGADMLLMPSRYEPCGLAQMIAMRYGCIPIARATGGLKDTISDVSKSLNATGFLFEEESGQALADTILKAVETYKNKPGWHIMQTKAMQKDFSWHQSALKYTRLYMGLQG